MMVTVRVANPGVWGVSPRLGPGRQPWGTCAMAAVLEVSECACEAESRRKRENRPGRGGGSPGGVRGAEPREENLGFLGAFFSEIHQLSPIWSIVTAADLEAHG